MSLKNAFIIKITHLVTGHFIFGATVNLRIYRRDMLKRLVNGSFRNKLFQQQFTKIEDVEFDIVEMVPPDQIEINMRSAIETHGKSKLFCNRQGKFVLTSEPATYILTLPSGHFYIGSTGNLDTRLRRHRSALKTNAHHSPNFSKNFTRWDDIGIEYKIYDNRQAALVAEQSLLDLRFEDPFCCNDSPLADGSNSHLGGARKTEHRANLSKALLGKPKLTRKGPVSIEGVVYDGLEDAASQIDLGAHSLHRRLASTASKFKDWFYVDRI